MSGVKWILKVGYKYSPDQPRHPKGDPFGGQWTSEGASLNLPSRGNALPDGVYKAAPRAFENVMAGAQRTYGKPADFVDMVDASVQDPYDAMDKFAAEHWEGDPRKAKRVLGKSPINRFIFKLENGKQAYELFVSVGDRDYGTWYVREGIENWSRKRSKDAVPMWEDVL